MQKTKSTISILRNTFMACVAAIHPAMQAQLQSLCNNCSYSGATPLILASREVRVKGLQTNVCQLLVASKADVSAKNLWYDRNPTRHLEKHILHQTFISRCSSAGGLPSTKLLLQVISKFAGFSFPPKLTWMRKITCADLHFVFVFGELYVAW